MTVLYLKNRHALAKIIDELATIARAILEKNPDIPYATFKKQVFEHSPLWHRDRKSLIEHRQVLLDTLSQSAIVDKKNEVIAEQIKSVVQDYCSANTAKTERPRRAKPARISIIGAGTAGLLYGLILAREGFDITIYEARSRQDAFLRHPNISFKEAEERLRPLLGEQGYQKFFTRGAALDGDTGKLRMTIGAFQEILYEQLVAAGAQVHFNHAVDLNELKNMGTTHPSLWRKPESRRVLRANARSASWIPRSSRGMTGCRQLQNRSHYDFILLATGTHTHKRFSLTQQLQIQEFPEYTAGGRTALLLKASQETHGYTRSERDGYHWRRANKTIFDHGQLGHDIKRLIRVFEKENVNLNLIDKLQGLEKAKGIEYTFIFGNDTPRFLEGYDGSNYYLIYSQQYRVAPMIALNPVLHFNDSPIIAIGDANSSAHPLAAIGTLKFIRNIDYLKDFVSAYQDIKELLIDCQQDDKLIAQAHQLLALLESTYTAIAMQNIKMVFFENILAAVFSEPRK